VCNERRIDGYGVFLFSFTMGCSLEPVPSLVRSAALLSMHIFYFRHSTLLHLSWVGLGDFTNGFLTNVVDMGGTVPATWRHLHGPRRYYARVYLITLGSWRWKVWGWSRSEKQMLMDVDKNCPRIKWMGGGEFFGWFS
jgi:hypothetical protein